MEKSLFTKKFGMVVFILNAVYFWALVLFNIELILESATSPLMGFIGYIFMFASIPVHLALLILNIVSLVKKQFLSAEITGNIAFLVALVSTIVILFIL